MGCITILLALTREEELKRDANVQKAGIQTRSRPLVNVNDKEYKLLNALFHIAPRCEPVAGAVCESVFAFAEVQT